MANPPPERQPGRLRRIGIFVFTLLTIELFDEFVFGVREAAWPLVRDDLGLNYAQIGVILAVPGLFSSIIEPFLGILGDVWRRRLLVLGGGTAFSLALLMVGLSRDFALLLLSFMLMYPAGGAFVTLSQATLMDLDPSLHEQNMARWNLAGSVGVLVGPLALAGLAALGVSWRGLYVALAVLGLAILPIASRTLTASRVQPQTPKVSSVRPPLGRAPLCANIGETTLLG